jgi:hypothetical protein
VAAIGVGGANRESCGSARGCKHKRGREEVLIVEPVGASKGDQPTHPHIDVFKS